MRVTKSSATINFVVAQGRKADYSFSTRSVFVCDMLSAFHGVRHALTYCNFHDTFSLREGRQTTRSALAQCVWYSMIEYRRSNKKMGYWPRRDLLFETRCVSH